MEGVEIRAPGTRPATAARGAYIMTSVLAKNVRPHSTSHAARVFSTSAKPSHTVNRSVMWLVIIATMMVTMVIIVVINMILKVATMNNL